MAKYIKSIAGRNEPVTVSLLIAASQTIEEGDLLQITSGKGELAVAASATLFGIAQEAITTTASVDDTDRIAVVLLDGAVIRIDTTGGDIADANLNGTTSYDLSDEKTLNVADVTGGMLKPLAYDNTNNTADVVVARANLALQ